MVVVSGARQVGKSTLLEMVFPEFPRVVFDPLTDIENARADPDLFLRNRRPPLILDEIQYAPELIPAVKRALDRDRSPGRYLITGSQQWEVMKRLAESLAGRAVFLDLDAFSLAEIEEDDPKRSWLAAWLDGVGEVAPDRIERVPLRATPFEQIWRGFLPEAQFLSKELIPDFLASYQRTYIERDVRQVAEVSDLALFARFFRLCAALTAQETNFSELGRELGITPQTASRWLDIFKATFQWTEVPAWSGNAVKRISGKPKGYVNDTGLACHALAITSPEALGGHPLWGAIFETAVMSEVGKQCRLLPTPPNRYHWRTHAGAEVDLLLERDGIFFPIEIKGKSHPSGRDGSGIAAFRKTYPRLRVAPGLIVAPCENYLPLADGLAAMPWDGRRR